MIRYKIQFISERKHLTTFGFSPKLWLIQFFGWFEMTSNILFGSFRNILFIFHFNKSAIILRYLSRKLEKLKLADALKKVHNFKKIYWYQGSLFWLEILTSSPAPQICRTFKSSLIFATFLVRRPHIMFAVYLLKIAKTVVTSQSYLF